MITRFGQFEGRVREGFSLAGTFPKLGVWLNEPMSRIPAHQRFWR